MHARIIGARHGIVGFECDEQLHATAGDLPDVKPILSEDQLPLAVDPRQCARHLRQFVNDGAAACKTMLEQATLADVEPPCGVGRRVIGRALAEMTALGRQHGCRHLFDQRLCGAVGHGVTHMVENR
ncbi:hypothetical protein ACVWW1_008139 [Bradyrhizobium sp. JR3.5]